MGRRTRAYSTHVSFGGSEEESPKGDSDEGEIPYEQFVEIKMAGGSAKSLQAERRALEEQQQIQALEQGGGSAVDATRTREISIIGTVK